MSRPSVSTVFGALGALGVLARVTLDDPLRTATWLLLAALAAKTWVAHLQERQEQKEEQREPEPEQD